MKSRKIEPNSGDLASRENTIDLQNQLKQVNERYYDEAGKFDDAEWSCLMGYIDTITGPLNEGENADLSNINYKKYPGVTNSRGVPDKPGPEERWGKMLKIMGEKTTLEKKIKLIS